MRALVRYSEGLGWIARRLRPPHAKRHADDYNDRAVRHLISHELSMSSDPSSTALAAVADVVRTELSVPRLFVHFSALAGLTGHETEDRTRDVSVLDVR